MPIKTLLQNLKLLGFDSSKHAKGSFQLDELLFSRNAVNNDKAFEHICVFLFRRIDRNRVKADLIPHMNTRTYVHKQTFITKVYRWLIEIRQGSSLFLGISVHKSVLSGYHGDNVIRIMIALSTHVLQQTLEQENHNDISLSAKSSSIEIQDSIKKQHESFNSLERSKNNFISKATQAANEVNMELSASESVSQGSIPLVTAQETRSLNQDLDSISVQLEAKHDIDADKIAITDHESSITTLDLPTAASSLISTPTFGPTKNTYSTHTSIPSMAVLTKSIPHNSPPDTLFEPSHSNFNETKSTPEAPRNYTNPTKPSHISLPAIDATTLAPIQFTYAKEPCQLPSFRHYFLENSLKPLVESPYWFLPPIYEFDSSSLLLTQHFSPVASKIPTPTDPASCKRKLSEFEESEDDQEDDANVAVSLSSPKRSRVVLAEIKTPPRQVSHLEWDSSREASPRSQRMNLEWDSQHEASPRSLETLEMVPPLMDESAPFRRIHQTEYFDIDFMTPRR